MTELTQTRLRDLLHYDPDTGVFLWLPRPVHDWRIHTWNKRYAGTHAGTTKYLPRGGVYLHIKVEYKEYKAHRLAWFYMTGGWPPNLIDHIDGDGLNNRWVNLRAATNVENSWNRKTHRDNITGFKGVTFHNQRGRYLAQIRIQGHTRCLGLYDTAQEAHAAYAAAAKKHFGEFARVA